MTYLIARSPRGNAEAPVPTDPETGEPFPAVMRYYGGHRLCYASDVEEMCAVLTGDPDGYLAASEHDRLVARIKVAIGATVVAQAAEVCASQRDGRWEKLTLEEQETLLSPRHVQPTGCSYGGVFGDHPGGLWLADVTLYVVETGYFPLAGPDAAPMPSGPPEHLKVVDPLTPEGLSDGLMDDIGSIEIYIRSVDGRTDCARQRGHTLDGKDAAPVPIHRWVPGRFSVRAECHQPVWSAWWDIGSQWSPWSEPGVMGSPWTQSLSYMWTSVRSGGRLVFAAQW